ncbi:signal peptide peptidase SppA [Myxococcota bacterium]|nr:signal peptide peptidase SppA [Myxococcota bacterium]
MLRLVFAALLWLLLLVPVAARFALFALRRRPKVIEVVLEGHHPLRPEPRSPFGLSRSRGNALARRPLANALREVGRDPSVEAVWVRIGHLTGGFGELHALREALRRVRAAGKRVVASLSHADTRALYVASAADEIIVSPHLPVDARGLALELTFFGEGLEKAGLGLDVVTAGAFKSAMEPFTRRGPSEASAEALDGLLTGLYDEVVTALATRPGAPRDEAEVRRALDAGPHLPEAARTAGLVDHLLEEEAVPEHLGCPEKGRTLRLRLEDYPGPARPWPRWRLKRPRLALIEVHGTITDGPVDDAEPTPGANAAAVCEALDRARRNKRIQGVLLHVDSRGGSATASERMWRAVRRLAAEKPVIASMGDYAASGGYYVASAAHGIVAAPGTLTGSIGVIAAKPVAEGLFAKLGIAHARFERGPQSTMYSPARRFTEAQRGAVERSIRHFYALFLRRVGEGRARSPESVQPVAEGRVWTGAQALAHGLVDRVGDEQVAIDWLAERAGVPLDKSWLVLLQPRVRWMRRLLPALPGRAGALATVLPELADLAELATLARAGDTPLAISPVKLSP